MLKIMGPLPAVNLSEKSVPFTEKAVSQSASGGFAELILNMKSANDGMEASSENKIISKIMKAIEEYVLLPEPSRTNGEAVTDMFYIKATEAEVEPGLFLSEEAVSGNLSAEIEMINKVLKTIEENTVIPESPLQATHESDGTTIGELTDLLNRVPSGETSTVFTLLMNLLASEPPPQSKGGERASGEEKENTFQTFRTLLHTLKAAGRVNKEDVKVLKSLLEKFIATPEGRTGTVPAAETTGSEEEKKLFRKLVNIIKEETSLPAPIRERGKLPVKETEKWGTQAVSSRSNHPVAVSEVKTEKNVLPGFFMPMSKAEQMTVQNVSTDSQNPGRQKFLNQIQEMITTSRIFHDEAGNQRMLIKLKPSSLGEMILKFSQSGGETTVRMIVSTQAAKETLESNMHQLRSIFAPHQVVVEKVEPNVNQQFLYERDSPDGREEREEEARTPTFEEETDEELKTEELSFSEILNEKV
ncbi:flagellar hook-length control protein FliK [Salimicrobium jeotgali]|uniref:flagellar hook-length control protein FliK n=2 Tax=Salimicrobium jeotgali TaxID=1230341 RepID=UPI0003061340|nr:flagellar hook-length control protein FliK [Salimicrobium jeotgali]MBM7695224.1 hypothetical protein [Salimicrobium jeotgali]